ncbi:hypothetical protein SAMN05216312_10214 [Cohnella sp. OV330]|uniref:hypothetical protein n=1 Tax=Cohnella sp. OV330 TaxID=1855288 RepID=UPI0008EB90BA|nr:hypothetical protein [Cohnella sp. OV330]SFA88033.1 hypothetical protein SAMN05216312_10214 [Cohnella sp. OV330]
MTDLNDPKWYDQLKGEPLRERNFTDTLAARIKEGANLPESRGPTYRRLAGAVLAAAVVAATTIFYEGLSDAAKQRSAEIAGNHEITSPLPVGTPLIGIKFGPADIEDERTETEAAGSVARRDLTLIQPDEDAKFQLWTVRYEDGSYRFGGDFYVKKESSQEWQRQGSSTFTEVASESRLSNLGLFSHAFSHGEYTVLAGQLTDDAIASAYLTDTNDERTDASIAQNADGRFWVAIVKGKPLDFTLQMVDRDGRPVGEAIR